MLARKHRHISFIHNVLTHDGVTRKKLTAMFLVAKTKEKRDNKMCMMWWWTLTENGCQCDNWWAFFFFFFFLSFFVVFSLFNFLVSLQRTSQLPGYHLRRTRPHFLQTPSITLCLCFNSRAAFINVRIAFQMEWKRRSVLFVLFCEFGSKLSRDPATGTDEITLTKRNIRHWARRCQCFHPYPQPLHPYPPPSPPIPQTPPPPHP